LRYLLDEDVNPAVANAARMLELDVVSVHEIGRRGEAFPDDAQLRFAASKRRVLVTRNRDDFIRLTVEFFQTGEPHSGVLIIAHNFPNKHPGRVARALKRWHDALRARTNPEPYVIDFLGGK
jgi:predicted nuclease of predicted toxin-antitoxin system